MEAVLCTSLLTKIHEQIERIEQLLTKVPGDRLDWTPEAPRSWPAARVVSHLLECLAGFCAVLAALHPERLSHFKELRAMPAIQWNAGSSAVERLAVYQSHIDEGFASLTDEDLKRVIPTVFVETGESALTLMLGNLEHLINHKHQLFTYLKMMGVEVGTADLYCLRPYRPKAV
jgi:hypothetical protein